MHRALTFCLAAIALVSGACAQAELPSAVSHDFTRPWMSLACVNDRCFRVKVLATSEEHLAGLSDTDLQAGQGALFVYEDDVEHQFTMHPKNGVMRVSLDIAFFDRSRALIHKESHDPCPHQPCAGIGPAQKKYRYVLEVLKGALTGFNSGARLRLIRPGDDMRCAPVLASNWKCPLAGAATPIETDFALPDGYGIFADSRVECAQKLVQCALTSQAFEDLVGEVTREVKALAGAELYASIACRARAKANKRVSLDAARNDSRCCLQSATAVTIQTYPCDAPRPRLPGGRGGSIRG